MNRKIIIVVVIIPFLLTTSSVFAVPVPFDAIYPVDYKGSTTQKTIFNWDDTPWLYLKLPEPAGGYDFNITRAWWSSSLSDFYFTLKAGFAQEVWMSLDQGTNTQNNPITWFDVREFGLWNINASYWYPISNEWGVGSTSFTVIPEPMTLTLLIVGGGGILAGRFYWKKRKVLSQ